MIKSELVQSWGNDLMVVNAARVSFGSKSQKLNPKDVKLINYLAKHKHYSPFEHMGATFLIKCPLYIRSQIMRHRTGAYNEISRRYTSKNLEFYEPQVTDIRSQSNNNKQCSEGKLKTTESVKANFIFQRINNECNKAYDELIKLGVSREQARGVLSQNLMTEFYMTMNLRNWIHFLKLRLGKDSQKEVRDVAEDISKSLSEVFFESYKALMDDG